MSDKSQISLKIVFEPDRLRYVIEIERSPYEWLTEDEAKWLVSKLLRLLTIEKWEDSEPLEPMTPDE